MSKSKFTDVVFIWHMHQPFYKVPDRKEYILPWVRLHGIKDYYGMAKTIDKFKEAKATFNFSGVLIYQLLDYVNNGARDYYEILTLKKPKGLKRCEKDFIVDRFFSINFERHIRSNNRYLQLHQKKAAGKKFTTQDIMDLQVIFNLAWFHPYTIKADKTLKGLIKKGKDFTQEEKEWVIKKQREILALIFPLYKKLIKNKKIEVSLTPYSHPIMPLVYDTDILKEFPHFKKPALRFSYPKDCYWHLQEAKKYFKQAFDLDVDGSWPSEGSVSEEVARVYKDEKFKWIGADEGILFRSLMTEFVSYDMIKDQRHIIYRPYNFKGVNVFFRDRNLSDTIGFVYQGWDDSKFAANDLIEHFKRTHSYIKGMSKQRSINIIMDGENAWEYYKNCGVDFLEALYSGIEKSDVLRMNTPSVFLQEHAFKTRKLERLAPGSWINSDFGVWVGSKENNRNWDILKRIRNAIDTHAKDKQKREQALECFHIIEGSDWNWWNTFEDVDGDFSKIFLAYVKKIYDIIGRTPPSFLR